MEAKLKRFMERVFQDVSYDNPMPGMGTDAYRGMASSGGKVIQELRRDVVVFAQQYRDSSVDKTRITAAAKRIEGHLKIAQALSVFSDKEAANILDELYALLSQR